MRQKQAKDKATNRFRNLELATLPNDPEIHPSIECPVNVSEATREREREKKVDGQSREREKNDGQKKNRRTKSVVVSVQNENFAADGHNRRAVDSTNHQQHQTEKERETDRQ